MDRQAADSPDPQDQDRLQEPPRLWLGLPARLLGLTIAFVMLAEILIYFPSAASYRLDWMNERAQAAITASLAVEAAPDRMVTQDLADELLMYAEVQAIAVKRNGMRELILSREDFMPEMLETVDLRDQTVMNGMGGALRSLTAPEDLTLRILAAPRSGTDAEFIEVLLFHQPLKQALIAYSWRILGLSVLISLITATLIYLSLLFILVRPIRRLSRAMTRFRDDPENAGLITRPSARRDEIGEAERAFADMQSDLRHALVQRNRLASLGAAVARISHDFRNILASAQLVSDRLAHEEDPRVRKMGERLVRSVSRGVSLTEDTLKYGKAEERTPSPGILALKASVEDAASDAGAFDRDMVWRNQIPDDAQISFDPDHLHRILVNLIRNGLHAMERARTPVMTVNAAQEGGDWVVTLADEGGGVPEKAKKTLFRPFGASGANGGAGLGLSIARELARANGGDVVLVSTGPAGSAFAVRAPAAP